MQLVETIDFTSTGTLALSSTVTSLGSLDVSTGTVKYDGSTQNVLADTYNDLSIYTSGTKTATGSITVTEDLTIDNAGVVFAIGSNTVTVAGTTSIGWGGGSPRPELEIGTGTFNADGTFYAYTYGAIDFTGAGNLVLSSTVTSLGNYLDNALGTVKYDGGTQSVIADSYYNLTIDNAGTKTAAGSVTVNNDLTVTSDGTYAVAATTTTVSGTSDIDGTLTISTGTLDVNDIDVDGALTLTSNGRVQINDATPDLSTFTAGTGTVEFDYGSTITLPTESYYNLEIDGNNASGATMSSGCTASNDVIVNSGSKLVVLFASQTWASLDLDGTLSHALATITVSGTSDIDGILALSSDFDADGTFDASNGEIQFPNASANLILSSTVTSLGTLPNDAGTVKYDGTSAQTVLADDYYNLTIENASTKNSWR